MSVFTGADSNQRQAPLLRQAVLRLGLALDRLPREDQRLPGGQLPLDLDLLGWMPRFF